MAEATAVVARAEVIVPGVRVLEAWAEASRVTEQVSVAWELAAKAMAIVLRLRTSLHKLRAACSFLLMLLGRTRFADYWCSLCTCRNMHCSLSSRNPFY